MDPARRDARNFAWLWFLAAASAVALAPLARHVLPYSPDCPLHEVTGVPCLSCGTTRATAALFEGRVLTAITWNPLAALAGMTFLLGGVAAPLWVRLGGPVPRGPVRLSRRTRLLIAGVLLANWVYLIVTGV